MSGLLLKDFYTIGHNAKQMILILLIWAVCFLPGRDGKHLHYYVCFFMWYDDGDDFYL